MRSVVLLTHTYLTYNGNKINHPHSDFSIKISTAILSQYTDRL